MKSFLKIEACSGMLILIVRFELNSEKYGSGKAEALIFAAKLTETQWAKKSF